MGMLLCGAGWTQQAPTGEDRLQPVPGLLPGRDSDRSSAQEHSDCYVERTRQTTSWCERVKATRWSALVRATRSKPVEAAQRKWRPRPSWATTATRAPFPRGGALGTFADGNA